MSTSLFTFWFIYYLLLVRLLALLLKGVVSRKTKFEVKILKLGRVFKVNIANICLSFFKSSQTTMLLNAYTFKFNFHFFSLGSINEFHWHQSSEDLKRYTVYTSDWFLKSNGLSLNLLLLIFDENFSHICISV